MPAECDRTPAKDSSLVELFFVEVCASHQADFSRAVESVHAHFKRSDGYRGIKILWLNNQRALMLLSWHNRHSFEKYLPQMLHGNLMKELMRHALVISHEPALATIWDSESREGSHSGPW